jgi:competence protein ComEC
VKVSHHGSARQDPALYQRVRPRAALVGVGPNTYGHPAARTLQLLTGLGAVVLRTDRTGDVALLEDRGGLAALARGG